MTIYSERLQNTVFHVRPNKNKAVLFLTYFARALLKTIIETSKQGNYTKYEYQPGKHFINISSQFFAHFLRLFVDTFLTSCQVIC